MLTWSETGLKNYKKGMRVRAGGSDNTSVIFLYFLATFVFLFLTMKAPPIIIRSSQKCLMSVRNAFLNLALGGTKFFMNYIAQIKLNEPWYKREPHSSESSV